MYSFVLSQKDHQSLKGNADTISDRTNASSYFGEDPFTTPFQNLNLGLNFGPSKVEGVETNW